MYWHSSVSASFLFTTTNAMKIDIDIEDYTIILNALHYYKKVEKRGNFQGYTEMRINFLRDKLAKQLVRGLEDE